jgi:hypothetical protein
MPDKEKNGDWLKDIDIARGIENTLVGAVLFLGRYFKTFFYIMVPSRALESTLIFNESYKPVTRTGFTRPLSFLVVSGFVYLAFTLATEGALIPIEPIVNEFRWFIDRFPHNFEELSLAKMSAFMVPFVMFVAMYSLICSVIFSWFGRPAAFKIHLNISAYIGGCCAVLTSLMAIVEGPLWDIALKHKNHWVNAIPLLAGAAVYLILLLWSAYRYLDLARRASELSWLRTMMSAAISFIVFWVATISLLRGLRPFLSKLH